MIIDTLNNLERYATLNPFIQEFANYLKENDLSAHAEGKVELKGKDLFVNFNFLKGKKKEDAKLETHDVMLDIQIPLNGPETYGYTPRENLPKLPCDAERDITFYDGLAEQYFTLQPGQFVIFFPQDGHAPCISEAETLQKVIVKAKNQF